MGPCCDEYESIGQAHDNWQESLFVHQQIGFPRPTHCHLLLAAVMGWSSTTASMRILPMSLLLLLLSPVGLAGQTTSNYSYLPQVSLTIRNTAGLTRKQEPKCSFRHVNTPQVAKLITLSMTFWHSTLQPTSALHALTACSRHSLVANMASVASTMVNVNVHRGGPESIA